MFLIFLAHSLSLPSLGSRDIPYGAIKEKGVDILERVEGQGVG